MSEEVTVKREPSEIEEARTESREQDVTTARPPASNREERVESRLPTNRGQEAMLPLFAANELQGFRARWENLQVSFVDEPRQSVEDADRLVCDAINELSRGFATERERLEQQWHRGENASTEDLRVTLKGYRSFFERLLSI